MNLHDTMLQSFGGFVLDTDRISHTSTDEQAIKLPYTGKLPNPYDKASLFIAVNPERVNIKLVAERNGKKSAKYLLDATRDEIDAILWPFFFNKVSEHEYHTRFNNGLSEYWNGHYQAEYIAWHSIGQSPAKITDIIQQLSPENRASLYRMIDHMRSEETIAE